MQWTNRFTPHDTHGNWTVSDGAEVVCYVLDHDHACLIKKAPDLKAALAWALDQIEDSLDPDHQAALAHARSLLED